MVYIQQAVQIGTTGYYNYPFNPAGFSVMIWLFSLIVHNYIIATKILVSVAQGSFFLLNYYVIKSIIPLPRSELIAGIAVILSSLSPQILALSTHTHIDYPFACFCLMMIYCFLQDFTTKNRYLFGIGIFGGLMSLIRWVGLFYFPFEIIAIVLRSRQLQSGNPIVNDMGKIVRSLSLFILTYFSILSPWLIYNSLYFGGPFQNLTIFDIFNNGQNSPQNIVMTYGSNFLLLLSRLWPSVLEKAILNFFLQIPLMFFTQQNFPFTIDLWQQILLAAFFYSVLVWVAWNHLETNIFPEYSLVYKNKITYWYTRIMQCRTSVVFWGFISVVLIQVCLGWVLFRFLLPVYVWLVAIFIQGYFLLADRWKSANFKLFLLRAVAIGGVLCFWIYGIIISF